METLLALCAIAAIVVLTGAAFLILRHVRWRRRRRGRMGEITILTDDAERLRVAESYAVDVGGFFSEDDDVRRRSVVKIINLTPDGRVSNVEVAREGS